jgi:hypothetical protein
VVHVLVEIYEIEEGADHQERRPGSCCRYAAIWIIGGRRRLKEGGHRITATGLLLDVGMRGAGAVALDNIARCSVLGAGPVSGGDAELWTVSPGERPNVLVELKAATSLAVTAFGTPRDISKRRIALYGDQPAEFVGAVTRAVTPPQRNACAG